MHRRAPKLWRKFQVNYFFLVLRLFYQYTCRMKFPTAWLTALLFSGVIIALTSVSAQAAVLTVTNTQDSGTGSLRDTIAAAS